MTDESNCKAWVTFTGDCEILDGSNNIKKVETTSTGEYTIYFKLTIIQRIKRLKQIIKRELKRMTK